MKKSLLIVTILLIVMAMAAFLPDQWIIKTSSQYPLPPQNSRASDLIIPTEVREASKNIVSVTGQTQVRSIFNPIINGENIEGSGTGFMIEPGIFVTAGHIITGGMRTLFRIGHTASFDKFGVPSSKTFKHVIFATTNITQASTDFPLKLAGLGNFIDRYEDLMILTANDYPAELRALTLNLNQIGLDEQVYASGYVAQKIAMGRRNDQTVLFDVLKKTYPGVVDAVIVDMPINKLGVSVLYRIESKMEFGFSGGPIFNKNGGVIGMTVLRNQNHLYAIAMKDIKNFLDRLRDLGGVQLLIKN